MTSCVVRLGASARSTLAIATLLGASALPAAAQRITLPPSQQQRAATVSITPYGGVMLFAPLAKGPLGTNLSNANGPLVGAQLGVQLSPNVSIIGNLARSTADLRVGVPIIGGFKVGSTTAWMYDAGLELGLGNGAMGSSSFSPFVQAGAGAMSYDIKNGVLDVKATNFAGNVGAGADVKVGSNMALRLLARDYIGKFNAKDATGFDFNTSTRNNWALTAGLRLSF